MHKNRFLGGDDEINFHIFALLMLYCKKKKSYTSTRSKNCFYQKHNLNYRKKSPVRSESVDKIHYCLSNFILFFLNYR